ncbi:MAG: hormogonium polysaccharide biosynthesis protein HpsA, partial [Xenococcus sp. (in: cyanobacteria)]
MSKFKLKKLVQSVLKQVGRLYKTFLRGVKRKLLHKEMGRNLYGRLSTAGFVLPTTMMVMLVVVLLTIAMMLRSFEQVDTARQTRVAQATLNAVAPAIERGRAKVDDLIKRTQEQYKQTPTDENIYSVLETERYTFGDEERLIIQDDTNGDGSIATEDNDGILENDEQLKTAWRFEVDTDNDGENDSYIIYGIYFRNPTRDAEEGKFDRPRGDLDARIAPMAPLTKPECQARLATSTNPIGDSGWYLSDGKLKKSFFVYAISSPMQAGAAQPTTPLEYQQDITRDPLTSYAVVYADDMEIAPSPEFRLNGAIIANSNFMVTPNEEEMRFYLVSGKNSCLYKIENSKINVGGNVFNGTIVRDDRQNDVKIDLFKPLEDFNGKDPEIATISTTNQSVSVNTSYEIANNDKAYGTLVDAMTEEQMAKPDTADPSSIRNDLDRKGQLQDHFRKLTRKVPFAEVALETEVNTSSSLIEGSGESLRPIEKWTKAVDDDSDDDETGLNLNDNQLEATGTKDGKQNDLEREAKIGDRVLVGNNQPEVEVDNSGFQTTPQITLGEWEVDGEKVERLRPSQVQTLPSVTTTERDGDWEIFSGEMPEAAPDGVGGLRVVTGAGVYERVNSFLPPPPTATYDNPNTANVEALPVVWPDTMAMSPSANSQVYDNSSPAWVPSLPGWPLTTTNSPPETPTIDPSTPKYAKGDLRMRASAVYHYAENGFSKSDAPKQTPIACVSSYYDPTSEDTAANNGGHANANEFPKSNNGIVYNPPAARPGKSGTPGTNGLIGGSSASALEKQANLVFPNGRFVNPTLRRALLKDEPPANRSSFDPEKHRTLSEQAAIDATQCALGIIAETPLATNSIIDNDAIKEATLLDARQVKATSKDPDSTEYDLPLEQRHPLEIRVTRLDLDLLRETTISYTESPKIKNLDPEYLLPYSGIIYASRDDAVPDQSNIDWSDIDLNDPEDLRQYTQTDSVS